MRKLTEAALRRKPDEQVLDRSKTFTTSITLTPGAREIHRRTRWSIPLCNAVAAAWGFGSVEV